MTPSQVYKMKAKNRQMLTSLDYPAIPEISGLSYPRGTNDNTVTVLTHYDGYTQYGDPIAIESVWFYGEPVMVVMTKDERHPARAITNPELYFKLIDHMVSLSIREVQAVDENNELNWIDLELLQP